MPVPGSGLGVATPQSTKQFRMYGTLPYASVANFTSSGFPALNAVQAATFSTPGETTRQSSIPALTTPNTPEAGIAVTHRRAEHGFAPFLLPQLMALTR